jgi:myo-inositol-1(or 4)-monophosphatase
VLLVREAGGKVCDYRGASIPRMDFQGAKGHQIVAGNLKVCEALQKAIVTSGYAASFN